MIGCRIFKRAAKRAALCGLVLAVAATAVPATAQTAPHTPARGSPERKAIVDTLRLPVSRMLKGKVVFAVRYLKVHRKWALLIGTPRRANGDAIDYADTKWAGKVRRQDFKDEIVALLRQRGTHWRVVWYEIGNTAPPWGDWAKRYRAPKDIFPPIKPRSPFD
jgi:hypothetical protein